MSDVARTIKSAIETQLATTLGADYSALSFVEDIEKNPFNKQSKGYGVVVGPTTQIAGVNRYLTFDQSYEVVLTEFYGKASMSDSSISEKHLDLIEKVHDTFKALANTRAGSASVVQVKDLSITEKEILETEKVIVVRATFNITYRTNLGS